MNSEQLRLFISGAFGNEADAKKIKRLLEPYLQRSLEEIRLRIEQLPDASLTRQREWRAILDRVDEVLEPYNNAFAIELGQQLPLSGAGAAEETKQMLQSVLPRTAGFVDPVAVMADSTKFLLNTKVNGRRVLGLFIPDQTGPSPFTKSIIKRIDQAVTGGIIRGEATAEIAKNLVAPLKNVLEANELAIARTAIQDFNRQVKEEIWDANREALRGLKYEWVAALDSRTCETCAPLDGAEKDSNNDFPITPVHVNCRCQVVLIDPDDEGKIRYGQEAVVTRPTGEGAYKTKKKVKGENLYRRKREVKTVDGKSPRYADFLASSNEKTQEMFFGGGQAGKARAEKFRKALKTKTPQKALIDLTSRVDKTAKVNTVKGAARKLKPVPAKPKVSASTAASLVEQRAIDRLSSVIGSEELEKALKAADTKIIAKATPAAVVDVKGINPVGLFNGSDKTLGRGAFGEARLTPEGVVKRGWLNRAELAAMERLGDSGVTPKLLGSAFEGEWKPRLFPGMNVRKGYMLMERALGEPLEKLISSGGGLTNKQGVKAFESLMRARKKIHLKGVAHQDMHPGNLMLDLKSEKLTVIDLGMSRVDARAALVEALGTGRGVMSMGRVTQAGDYQSRLLFNYFNQISGTKKTELWKRFERNRRKVIETLIKEGAGETANASIRKLPKSVTKNLTAARALELLEQLYEGI